MTTVEFSSNVWKRSFRTSGWVVLGLLATFLSVGCGGVPKTYYYTLQVPAAPPPNDPKTGYVLGVERFRAPEMLRDDRIVYYVSPTQMNYYQYHRWGADPATMLSEFTAQWVGSTGVFAEVRILPARERLDYMLAGRVLSFEEVDHEGGGNVRVALELLLMRTSDHKVIWSSKQRVEAPLQERGVEGVAGALSASCAQLLREMTPGLIAQVEQDYRASQGQTH
ncbi:MAG: ABC-type transport auxiliary lipoprotein family protein [Terriglobia bacterium]